jgi:hypothetical protein
MGVGRTHDSTVQVGHDRRRNKNGISCMRVAGGERSEPKRISKPGGSLFVPRISTPATKTPVLFSLADPKRPNLAVRGRLVLCP